jgi:hypothetical protein
MQRLGRDVHWVAPGVVGKNALDFILAMHVGIHHEKADPGVAFAILSADKGYDPLLKELAHDDRTAVRVNPERAAKKKTKKRRTRAAKKTAAASASEPEKPATKKKKRTTRKVKTARASEAGEGPGSVADLVDRVAERLDRMSEERLPTREKTLLKHVESQLPAEYQEKAASVVRGLVRRKRVRIQAGTGTVTYPRR